MDDKYGEMIILHTRYIVVSTMGSFQSPCVQLLIQSQKEKRGSRIKQKPSIGGCYGDKGVLKNSFSCILFLSLWVFYVLLVSLGIPITPGIERPWWLPVGNLKCQKVLQKTRARSVLTSGVRCATWKGACHWWVYLWLFSFSLRYQKKIICDEKSGKGDLTSSEILYNLISPSAFRFTGSSFLGWRTLFLSRISCTRGSNNSAGLGNSVSSLPSKPGTRP